MLQRWRGGRILLVALALGACDTGPDISGPPETQRALVTGSGGARAGGDATADVRCTRPAVYWKKHYDRWPAGITPRDPFFASGRTWLQVLRAEDDPSPYYLLARQYIAAVLNALASGRPRDLPQNVEQAVTAAADYYSDVAPWSGARALALTRVLRAFNEGRMEAWPRCS